jgi:hypothetical protein
VAIYKLWTGYLPDHEFEENDYAYVYSEARSAVLAALEEEAAYWRAEYANAPTSEEAAEYFGHWNLYRAANDLLTDTESGAPFDVTIRGERFGFEREPNDLPDFDTEEELLEWEHNKFHDLDEPCCEFGAG